MSQAEQKVTCIDCGEKEATSTITVVYAEDVAQFEKSYGGAGETTLHLCDMCHDLINDEMEPGLMMRLTAAGDLLHTDMREFTQSHYLCPVCDNVTPYTSMVAVLDRWNVNAEDYKMFVCRTCQKRELLEDGLPQYKEVIALPTDEQIIQAARNYAEYSESRLIIEKAVKRDSDDEKFTWFVDITHKDHPEPYTFIVRQSYDGFLTVQFHDV